MIKRDDRTMNCVVDRVTDFQMERIKIIMLKIDDTKMRSMALPEEQLVDRR